MSLKHPVPGGAPVTAPAPRSPSAPGISPAAVEQLAAGVLDVYAPPLRTVQTHLKELTERQESVCAALTAERKRLQDLQNDAITDALIANVAMSRERLVAVSTAMMSLHKRVTALQTRAAHIGKVASSRAGKQKS